MADVTTIPVDADGDVAEAPPPPDVTWTTPRADPKKEYVRGAVGYAGLAGYLRALPPYIDDLTRDFGSDLYERILRDSQVFACIHILKLMVLAEGWQLHRGGQEEEEAPPDPSKPPAEPTADEQLAQDITAFCKRQLTNLGAATGQLSTFDGWLYEMLDALCFGHKIAEKTFDDGSGEDDGRLVLAKLKVKPRRVTSFVVDEFLNLLGLLKAPQGIGSPALVGALNGDDDPGQNPDLVPREKFCVLTWAPKDGDPRGTSILRPAYDPWFRKQQTKGEELKFLAQAAAPSLVGFTAPGAQPARATDSLGLGNPVGVAPTTQANPTGAATLSPEQAMVNVLEGVHGGSCGAFPHGADVKWLTSGSDGSVFRNAKDSQDREITMAILCQTLATMEGQHQARAAAETHQDTLSTVAAFIRRWAEAMVKRDILYYLVAYNWGKEVADRLTPDFKLGGSKPITVQDVAALAGKMSPFLDPSQYPALDKRLGLPTRAPTLTPVPGQPMGPDGKPLPNGVLGTPPNGSPTQPPVPGVPPVPPKPAAFAGLGNPLPEAEQARLSRVDPGDVTAAAVLWRRLKPKRKAKR